MEFQVLRNNVPHMRTTSVNCIPFVYLDQMESEGYKFSLDGKIVPKAKIKQLSNSSEQNDSQSCARCAKIRCITTDELFNTQSEAARKYGIDPAQVSDSIKTGRPRSGYRFEKVDKPLILSNKEE